MMEGLKNSVFSKVLQVLLIGYFLISSLNLSNNLNRVATTNDDIHTKDCVVWSMVKKMLKCNTAAEEFEDSDNEAGCGNSNKIKLAVDYLIPGCSGLMLSYSPTISGKKLYAAETNPAGILHNRIHVPPPEITL